MKQARMQETTFRGERRERRLSQTVEMIASMTSFFFHPVARINCIHTTSFFFHPYPRKRPRARVYERTRARGGERRKKSLWPCRRSPRIGPRSRRLAPWPHVPHSRLDATRGHRVAHGGSAQKEMTSWRTYRYFPAKNSQETSVGTVASLGRVLFRCPNFWRTECFIRNGGKPLVSCRPAWGATTAITGCCPIPGHAQRTAWSKAGATSKAKDELDTSLNPEGVRQHGQKQHDR